MRTEFPCHSNCFNQEIDCGNDASNEAPVKGFDRGDSAACGEHLESAGAADESREALRAAPASEDAERAAGMREDSVRLGDANVAREREVETAAHAEATDRCDDWVGRKFDCAEDPLA